MYRLHQRLNVGLEWNPGANELGPLANAFLLNARGEIVAQWNGEVDPAEVRQAVEKLLGSE